ncbi:hypothetical protein SAMD00019534_004430 [Acytostelium subglobosum LB1]|uniref:hypothetical protein n=1 Tax=Acytostelium subglobosum LB1 TaxID=1410327 RepID=UPI000644F765|nr:hypothetical protein SAMD00019534_004430 [Acytostelium subglobosum LB1]GAM17268.1 hypothetical protein SAMD00019534_004430 [Acytostelium subglobosum LB1]|eukprot:XP_012759330.1 hypothetical protein SAMD00019534_004430 [Acytostelium subglobosum LB1]
MATTTHSPITRAYSSSSKIIVLEGNISAGKTYLSNKLGQSLDYKVFLEPTTTNPYLQQFYAEPKRYALDMQLWLLNQRYNTYLAALDYALNNDNSGVVLDRSMFSDWVFAENCRKEGLISPEGFKQYTAIRDSMLLNVPIPNITLYLNVSPSECLRRIQSIRKRTIPLTYLEGLDICYQEFLKEIKLKGSNVITFDWNQFGEVDDIVTEIKKDISSTSPSLLLSKNIIGNLVKNREDITSTYQTELSFMHKESLSSTSSSAAVVQDKNNA